MRAARTRCRRFRDEAIFLRRGETLPSGPGAAAAIQRCPDFRTELAVSGLGAGLAGVIIASRVGAGQANASVGIELTVIAAMVVGGTSIMGGEGSVARSFLGVLLLALILNGFNLLGVPSEYHRVFQGIILLIAVGADVWSRRSR